MADDLTDFAVRLQALAQDLSGPQMAAVLSKVGVEAKKDVAQAIRSDIGDLSMSHWRVGKPIQIGARFDADGPTGIVISPMPRARGPFRVLEDGRRAGTSKPRGPQRLQRTVRHHGSSRGKGTWTDATVLIEKNTPDRLLTAIHEVVLKRLG